MNDCKYTYICVMILSGAYVPKYIHKCDNILSVAYVGTCKYICVFTVTHLYAYVSVQAYIYLG